MAINSKTWANEDHISVVTSQNVQDNSVNVVDDIHEQYFGSHNSGLTYELEDTGATNGRFRIFTPAINVTELEITPIVNSYRRQVGILNVKLLPSFPYNTINFETQAKVSDITNGSMQLEFNFFKRGTSLFFDQKIGTDFSTDDTFETSNKTYNFAGDSLIAGDILTAVIVMVADNVNLDTITVKDVSMFFS